MHDDYFPEEKYMAILRVMLLVVLAAVIMIPFAWMYLSMHTINPFDLKGPPFLSFYSMLSAAAIGVALLLRMVGNGTAKAPHMIADVDYRPVEYSIARWLIVCLILLGISRLIRGIYLGRPVGYLCMMLLADIVLSLILFNGAKRQQ